MRSVIISFIIIVLILSTAIINSLWTSNTIDNIIEEIKKLTLDKGDISDIKKSWDQAKKVFALTVHRIYLREIDDAFQKAEAAISEKDEFEFDTAKSALIYKMKEMRNSQSFDAKTIL